MAWTDLTGKGAQTQTVRLYNEKTLRKFISHKNLTSLVRTHQQITSTCQQDAFFVEGDSRKQNESLEGGSSDFPFSQAV